MSDSENQLFRKNVINLFNDLFLFAETFVEKYPHIHYSKQSWPIIVSSLKTTPKSKDLSIKTEFDFYKLDIKLDWNSINEIYNKTHTIVFRNYNGEDCCVIGCGNYPLANCGGYPFQNDEEKKEYHTYHHHENCYTINPEPSYNPSIVGFFSSQKFPTIPDKSFKKINIEGTRLVGSLLFFTEIIRMLKDNGEIYINDYHCATKINNKLKIIDSDDAGLQDEEFNDCIKNVGHHNLFII